MINNFIDRLEGKNIKIVERPFTSVLPLSKIQLKQVDKPQTLISYGTNVNKINDFISPYAKTNKVNVESKINITGINNNSRINGIKPQKIDVKKHLESCHDKNITIDGWSAKDIVQYRNEIKNSLKPETLEALKNLTLKRKAKETKVETMEETKENDFLSTLKSIMNTEEIKVKEVIKPAIVDENKDLSFMPIQPNRYLNMNKIEMDKLEWMKYVEKTADNAKSKSIRFHIDGSVITPDEVDQLMPEIAPQFDSFMESLNHHGDEPDRNGYTISELFHLARSSFPMQRNLAVISLTNMIKQSNKLQHVYHFNMPTITASLVDCGVVFLTRWLIDDAGEREQHLYSAIGLLHAILVCNCSDNDDNITFYWPNQAISLPMIAKEALIKQIYRINLPPSEQNELKDDQLMDEDMISCLVTRTHLLDRLSYLLLDKQLLLNNTIHLMIIEIIQRMVRHSLEVANIVCHNHYKLVQLLINMHIINETECSSTMTRLIRYLCQASSSIAHKLTRDQLIITKLYKYFTDIQLSPETTNESTKLITVMITLDIHKGPIDTLIPILIDHLYMIIPSLLDDVTSPPLQLRNTCQSILSCLIKYISHNQNVISSEMFTQIRQCILMIKKQFISSFQNANQNQCYSLQASIVQLIITFSQHEYNRPGQSSYQVAIDMWHQFICPILSHQNILSTILKQSIKSRVLAYEYCHSNMQLFSLDLHNLLYNSTRIAVRTRNTQFIDSQPFFISMCPSYNLLSAICHAIQFIESTHVKPPPDLISNEYFITNMDAMIQFITPISNSPMDKMCPINAYAIIVQLQLETAAQLVLSVRNMNQWISNSQSESISNNQSKLISNVLFKATLKIVPFLGISLQVISHQLLENIMFNGAFIASLSVSDMADNVLQSVINSISTVRDTYAKVLPQLSTTVSPRTLHTIDNLFIPRQWIDVPFVSYYQPKISTVTEDTRQIKPSSIPIISTSAIIECLYFVMLLESENIVCDHVEPIAGISRLSYLMMCDNWGEVLSDEVTQSVISTLLHKYLSRPHLIDKKSMDSFSNIHTVITNQYFSVSNCQELLANLVVFPCAMRFPVKWRKSVWDLHFDNIHLITMALSDSILPVEEYLLPEEKDCFIIVKYWDLLRLEKILEGRNELLYWISIHHVNRFIFDQSLCGAKYSIQQGISHALINPSWQNKSWIQHLKMYKQIVAPSTVQFYNDLPLHRIQHLDKLFLTTEDYFKKNIL